MSDKTPDKTYASQDLQIDKHYYATPEVPPPPTIEEKQDDSSLKGEYFLKYITFYSLNQMYIWGGILFIFFVSFFYLLLFSIYLRVNAYKHNIAAPFSAYDYDAVPVANYLTQLYWKLPSESFEPMNQRGGGGKRRKKPALDYLATLWGDIWLIPTTLWKLLNQMRMANENVNKELSNLVNPHYERFTAGLNRMVDSKESILSSQYVYEIQ
jgi:hypothetical protein